MATGILAVVDFGGWLAGSWRYGGVNSQGDPAVTKVGGTDGNCCKYLFQNGLNRNLWWQKVKLFHCHQG
jgi:hypothetical protein